MGLEICGLGQISPILCFTTQLLTRAVCSGEAGGCRGWGGAACLKPHPFLTLCVCVWAWHGDPGLACSCSWSSSASWAMATSTLWFVLLPGRSLRSGRAVSAAQVALCLLHPPPAKKPVVGRSLTAEALSLKWYDRKRPIFKVLFFLW